MEVASESDMVSSERSSSDLSEYYVLSEPWITSS